MDKPLLTVIIPVYNASSTLRDCVDSVLVQAQRSVELVLVDDGSNEETATICDTIAKERPDSVRVIHQKNSGSLAARMAGSKVATGDYFMYVDADDILLDGAIGHILKDISSGADLYLYDYIMESVGGQTASTVKLMDHSETTEFSATDKHYITHVFMKGMMNTVCATAIRRSFYEKLTFDLPKQKICHGEDRLQKLQMLVHAQSIIYVPYAFYYYKWYPSTQGGDLRTGKFSAEIYENFRLTWPIERGYYSALGFNEKDRLDYDRKKLAKICGLLENAWCNKTLSSSETDSLVRILQLDELFLSLSESKILCGVRTHVQRTAKMICAGKHRQLKFYWSICKFIRNLRYGS